MDLVGKKAEKQELEDHETVNLEKKTKPKESKEAVKTAAEKAYVSKSDAAEARSMMFALRSGVDPEIVNKAQAVLDSASQGLPQSSDTVEVNMAYFKDLQAAVEAADGQDIEDPEDERLDDIVSYLEEFLSPPREQSQSGQSAPPGFEISDSHVHQDSDGSMTGPGLTKQQSGLVGKKVAHNKIKLASITSSPEAVRAFQPLDDGRYVVTADVNKDWGIGTIWQLSEEGGEQILARVIEDEPSVEDTKIIGEAAVGKKLAKTASIHHSQENTEKVASNLPLGGTEIEAAIFEEGIISGDIVPQVKEASVESDDFEKVLKVLAAKKPKGMSWAKFAEVAGGLLKKLAEEPFDKGEVRQWYECPECGTKSPDKKDCLHRAKCTNKITEIGNEALTKSKNAAEMSSRSNPKLWNRALEVVQAIKFNPGKKDYLETIIRGMNPKKLSPSDIDSLKDIIEANQGI